MSLAPGDKLGSYEVLALLGKGGMGEVYRAHDAKLNRDVAVKVLPPALAKDTDYIARFQREAQTLAALNHPNIASIYGLEGNAIVMELVEGETLQGPLPLAEALPIARQIAEALEAAHDKGIIHRDLKPGNVKVTPEGVIKVLDFGLAKAVERSSASGADSPTLTMGATEAGLILGTAGYMSPEQAAGKPVDRRADIWSFGVVLYELLTGKRLFDGETVTHTLADVVRAPIDYSVIPEGPVRELVRRCLDRNIKNRLSYITEARIVIENAGTAPVLAPVRAQAGWWPWVVAGVSSLAFLVAGVGWYRSSTRPAPPQPLIRLNAEIAPDTPLASVGRFGSVSHSNLLALSPDGSRIALVLRAADGKTRLHTRLLHQAQLTALSGTDNAEFPFFSADGEWIGFFAERKLKKISATGGATVTLCDAPIGRGASWGDDGRIIAALNATGALSWVPVDGGAPVPATKLNPGERSHRWPQALPGSRSILFTAANQISTTADFDGANIDVLSLRTGERKTIVRQGYYARYLATPTGGETGHVVYMQQRTLFTVPFDQSRLEPVGVPTPILENVGRNAMGGGDYAIAQDGTFVYLPGEIVRPQQAISWVDSTGKIYPLHAPPGQYSYPRFSPDGKRLAFSKFNGVGTDIWVKDLDRDTLSRLTFLPGVNTDPVWSPDGKIVVFTSNSAPAALHAVPSDGSVEATRLTESFVRPYSHSFSPDGKSLALSQTGSSGGRDLFTMAVEADPGRGAVGFRLGKAELFLGTPSDERDPAFSPDGRWLAYVSDESGTFEVYVRPFPGPGGRWQISTGGGLWPMWSRDRRELFFQTLDGHVMAVSYEAGFRGAAGSFAPGKPRLWTAARVRNIPNSFSYDLAPDGKRLAAIVDEGGNSEKLPTHLTFLLNFGDELRRKAPVGK